MSGEFRVKTSFGSEIWGKGDGVKEAAKYANRRLLLGFLAPVGGLVGLISGIVAIAHTLGWVG